MKRLSLLAVCIVFFGSAVCCMQRHGESLAVRRHPIKASTTRIVYSVYSNSGVAIYTRVEISRGLLVWDRNEMREGCHLRDSVSFAVEDFDALVERLSGIGFSVKGKPDVSSGGSGSSYSFWTEQKCYLSYDDSRTLVGDHEQVAAAIDQFIGEHPTKGGAAFERLSNEPHEKGMFSEFKTLPEELEPYLVK